MILTSDLAREMLAQLRATGQAQQTTIDHPSLDRECKLILRYGPERKTIQVLTAIDGRQPPQQLREDLGKIFDVDQRNARFDYINGYGIMKLTWYIQPPPALVQAPLFDLPEIRTENYYAL